MRPIVYERIWIRVYVVGVLVVEMQYWTRGISYKFSLLDKVKIRSSGRLAIKKIGHPN